MYLLKSLIAIQSATQKFPKFGQCAGLVAVQTRGATFCFLYPLWTSVTCGFTLSTHPFLCPMGIHNIVSVLFCVSFFVDMMEGKKQHVCVSSSAEELISVTETCEILKNHLMMTLWGRHKPITHLNVLTMAKPHWTKNSALGGFNQHRAVKCKNT